MARQARVKMDENTEPDGGVTSYTALGQNNHLQLELTENTVLVSKKIKL